jgi:hypothetical protein
MKSFLHSFLIILILVLLHSLELNAQVFNWANSISGDAIGYSISNDAAGNSYVTGAFTGPTLFGSIQLTSDIDNDIFIAKFDPNGNCIWAKQAGGPHEDCGKCIKTDASGNSYITGFFTGPATFGLIPLAGFADFDIFVAKYDSSGNCIWASQAGGAGDDIGSGISIDASGNTYVTGTFSGSANFGSFQLISTGSSDIFIAKYDPNGNCLWADHAGGTLQNFSNSISIDANGNSYITGTFYINALFGSLQLTSLGRNDLFIAKYDILGNLIWVKQAGGVATEGRGISVDSSGNIYVTGYFIDSTIFGNIKLISFGSGDAFIAKYDSSGNCKWVNQAGGTFADFGQSIAIDAFDNIYFTGYYINTATFGTNQLNNYGSIDAFISKYDSSGNYIWALHAGGPGDDFGRGISVDANQNCYITGDFQDSVLFGSIKLLNPGAFVSVIPNFVIGIKDKFNSVPKDYSLLQNFPNPFNPSTTIKYALPFDSYVRIIIYNLIGQQLKEIVSGFKQSGIQEINFNASALSSGVYFYSLSAISADGKHNYTSVKKMMLLK